MKISHSTSEFICLLVHNLKKSIDYTKAIQAQPEVSMEAKQNLIIPIKTKLNWSIAAIERRVGPESAALYKNYIKDADSILLDNCHRMIAAMPPPQQELIEELITSIYKGEKIQFSHAK
jgi:hypothetical protein